LAGSKNLLMRIFIAALALCALSFAAGVAGDLSLASQPAGPSASVTIPADAVRAGPLAALPRTATAEAAPPLRRMVRALAPMEKPRAPRAKAEIKLDGDSAPKADAAKAG
jgi:hypothetical protein